MSAIREVFNIAQEVLGFNELVPRATIELDALIEVKDAAKIIVDVVNKQHDIPIGECPHGNAPVYPSHGRWCDRCFDRLEDALSELERLTK